MRVVRALQGPEREAREVKVAWLFPGQGSQSVGMGRDVVAASPAAREVFDRVDAALGQKLSAIILDGPADELTLTANAQPAILATSMALLAALRERHPALPWPTVAAGHSLGEYSALVAAQALTLEDAARIVRARGIAMQEAVPPGVGAMSAVMGLDRSAVESLCEEARQGELVSAANFNAPGQVVIAGHAAAVARAGELASARGGRVVALNVSAPFHCALMRPAARALESTLTGVSVAPLRFPIVANVDARQNDKADRVKELLVRQVDGAVRWDESVSCMAGEGVTKALEIGPGKVLSSLVKRIDKRLVALPVNDAASVDRAAEFLAGAAS